MSSDYGPKFIDQDIKLEQKNSEGISDRCSSQSSNKLDHKNQLAIAMEAELVVDKLA